MSVLADISIYNIVERFEIIQTRFTRIDVAVATLNNQLFVLIVKLLAEGDSFFIKSFIPLPADAWLSPNSTIEFIRFQCDVIRGELKRNKPKSNFEERHCQSLLTKGDYSYSARVVIINDYLYVAFSKFWFCADKKKFLPTRPQVYLTEEAFEKLLQFKSKITDALNHGIHLLGMTHYILYDCIIFGRTVFKVNFSSLI